MPLLTSRPAFTTLALLASAAGLLAPLGFSPLNIWPLGLVSVAALVTLLWKRSPRQAAWLGWYYGLGFFGLGASWVYVSINVYGNADALLAGLLTALFVMGLALLFALQCWVFQRFFRAALGFAALWVLFEWLRGWLLTGFPWLYLGYAHVDTWLAGLAPVVGVMGISFVVALSAAMLFHLCRHCLQAGSFFTPQRPRITFVLCLLWAIPALLQFVQWVEHTPGETLSVGLVQGNIDQNIKFDQDFLQENLDTYERLSFPLWGNDILLWPETAVPMLYQQAGSVIEYWNLQGQSSGTALITGILSRENGLIHNSIISLGDGFGTYHKQKLVPFGEYVPFRSALAGLLQLFDLPMSSLSPGPADQPLLSARGLSLAAFICYEVVYPDFVRRNAQNADFLVTISNDTWFGGSWGPLQHLQMAAMRALENGRYMIRATNNGVSAIIDHRGNIVGRTRQFQAETLQGSIAIMRGRTPFSYLGSWPVLFLCVLILLLTGPRPVKFPAAR